MIQHQDTLSLRPPPPPPPLPAPAQAIGRSLPRRAVTPSRACARVEGQNYPDGVLKMSSALNRETPSCFHPRHPQKLEFLVSGAEEVLDRAEIRTPNRIRLGIGIERIRKFATVSQSIIPGICTRYFSRTCSGSVGSSKQKTF